MLGRIEILVIAGPGNKSTDEIMPALNDLVDSETISIVGDQRLDEWVTPAS